MFAFASQPWTVFTQTNSGHQRERNESSQTDQSENHVHHILGSIGEDLKSELAYWVKGNQDSEDEFEKELDHKPNPEVEVEEPKQSSFTRRAECDG